jgi:D-alanyl-D-alanine carboxypeptidase/D-alanyl-D-alanine-endopeptidase (penicillin-binding protein 4)
MAMRRALAFASLALVGMAAVAHADPPAPGSASPAPRVASTPRIDPAKLQASADELKKTVTGLGATVGVHAIDLDTGLPVARIDESTARNPASNAKLATALAALDRLGPQHRFATGLYGTVDAKGTVAKLVLRGRGDPSLRDADLWDMARELTVQGVKRVETIAVDQGAFGDRWVPPAFEQQPEEWAPFRANVAPLSIDGNVVTVWVRAANSEGAPATIVVDPPGALVLEGKVDTGSAKSKEAVRVDLRADRDRLVAKLGGSVPSGARALPITKRADDPRKLGALAMREALRGAGIAVGDAVELGGGGETQALVVHTSRPLGELLTMLGKESDNFAAEMVLLGLAPSDTKATPEAGATAVREVLEKRHAFDAGMRVTNGSGLFDANRSSPRALTSLLRSAWEDPRVGTDFVAQLAIGGVDGTLKNRLRSWADTRAIRAKSGTLAATVALSGYVLRPAGQKPVVFSVIVSDCRGKSGEARNAIDKFVDGVARQAWGR